MKEYRVILKGAQDEFVDADGWSVDTDTGTIALYVENEAGDGSVKFVAVFNIQAVIGIVEL